MIRPDETDDPRRRLLIQALSAGLFAAALNGGGALAAEVSRGGSPKLPAGRSIYRMSGKVLVNENPATIDTRIAAGDTVETPKGGELVFVVGENAMLMRESSRLELQTEQVTSMLIKGFRMLTGGLLSVSRNRPMQVTTATATIGIRGTGFYLEADPQQTYFCTCYGVTDVEASEDKQSRDHVVSSHHDRALYILAGAKSGQSIRPAPFINHTDQELMLIETLVGRTPPFVFPGNSYNAPRRGY
jgi:hypothetical protein